MFRALAILAVGLGAGVSEYLDAFAGQPADPARVCRSPVAGTNSP
jgi:hypothetical protein